MPKPAHVLIVAGDPSGDHHGGALAAALRHRLPDVKISAAGGTYLKQSADTFIYPLVGLGGFGFWEPLLQLPALLNARRAIQRVLREQKPDVVIPIDFYGFNIHVARAAKAQGIPVAYYVSPQVWASRPGRVQELSKVVSRMLVIFPFEVELYRRAGVSVKFVGHPLLDRVPEPLPPIASAPLVIGLMPGSRIGVIAKHLPILVRTVELLRSAFPQSDFVLFRPAEIPECHYRPLLARIPWLRISQDADFKLRKSLTLAISVSGTAALENTLLGIPMVIMYKLSSLTYAIARRLIRVPYVAIPNLLAERELVPELLQDNATPEKIAEVATGLLKNKEGLLRTREELLTMRRHLGEPGSARRAAEEIAQLLYTMSVA